MEIPDFISYLREKDETNVEQYIQFENVMEARTSHFFLPQCTLKEQSLIHEKLFKDCVKQAATNCHADDRIWKEFEWLFRNYCKAGGNLKQYSDGMRHAGSTAWNIVRYIQNQQDSISFGKTVENAIFSGLKENMQIDFFQPNLIYELKFTESDKAVYEKNMLVNDIIRAVLHVLVTGVKQVHTKLGILVYYWKLKSIVFDTTEAHQNEDLVAMLEGKLLTDDDTKVDNNNEEESV